ncbi:MAG: hypothetical protein AAF738_09715 [Bacteroidota bacterium]
MAELIPIDGRVLQVIEFVAQEYRLETMQNLALSLQGVKLFSTRTLVNSLSSEQRSDLSRVVTSVLIAFEDYGRYHDMRGHFYDYIPDIEKIKEWITKKGLAAFGEDPHPYKHKIKSDERRKNEIAWGYAKSLYLGKRKFIRRKWYQSNFYATLSQLQEDLSIAMADEFVEELADKVTDGLSKQGIGKFL